MKKQLIVGIFLLVIVTPTAFVENVSSSKIISNENFNYKIDSSIDSDLLLTKKHIISLEISATQINDLQIKRFILKIVDLINDQDKADKNDIINLINSLNLNSKIKGIHFLCFLHSDGIGYGYPRGIYPFIFECLFYNLIFTESFLGPSIFVEWKSPDANTRINGIKIYDEPHNGYVLGFLGYTFCDGIWPVIYRIIGVCSLVIITEFDI